MEGFGAIRQMNAAGLRGELDIERV